MKNLLEKIKIDKPYLEVKEDRKILEKVVWVKPKYVCEVEFLEFTRDLKLRAPSFKRLRNDKSVEECVLIR